MMKITIPVPVTFTTDAPRHGTRTALTFVPTEFDVLEAADAEAPVVGKRFREREGVHSSYRIHDGHLYGTLARNDGRQFANDFEYEIDRLVGPRTLAEIEGLRVDDLHPKDAKELMARVGPEVLEPQEEHNEYRRIVEERSTNRRMAALTLESPDFEAKREQTVAFVADAISRLLLIDGVRYQKTEGIAITVNTDYNRTIEVSETEMWDGSMDAEAWPDHAVDQRHEDALLRLCRP
jgi:hypothetical protein